jgi:hypothetical protein
MRDAINAMKMGSYPRSKGTLRKTARSSGDPTEAIKTPSLRLCPYDEDSIASRAASISDFEMPRASSISDADEAGVI